MEIRLNEMYFHLSKIIKKLFREIKEMNLFASLQTSK